MSTELLNGDKNGFSRDNTNGKRNGTIIMCYFIMIRFLKQRS